MINPLVKTITVDGFYTQEQAKDICAATYYLEYKPTEFGKEIPNFNLVPPNMNELISDLLNTKMEVNENSGTFRIPQGFIHFEGFDSTNEWLFCVALQQSTFNVFEHKSGCSNALQEYKYNYRDLFQWDLMVNHILKPGQGILFRPWLFHSFDIGQIQIFRLKEIK